MAHTVHRIRNWLYTQRAQELLIVFAGYLIATMILIGSVQFVKGIFSALPIPQNLGLPKIETVQVRTTDPITGLVTTQSKPLTTLETKDQNGQVLIKELVLRVVNVAKLALQIACVLYIIWIGTDFILNLSNDEVLKKKQNHLLYALLGFIIINMGDLLLAVFAPPVGVDGLVGSTAHTLTGGEFVQKERLISGWLGTIDLILTIMKVGIGIVSVVTLIFTGYKMVSAQEKNVEKEKKHVLWVAVGLMFVLIAHLIQRAFLTPDMYGFFTGTATSGSFFDSAFASGHSLILTIARLILFMMVPVGFFFLILASTYLLTANGDAGRVKKAKNIFIGTAVAMLMAYSAYAVIAEVIVNVMPPS